MADSEIQDKLLDAYIEAIRLKYQTGDGCRVAIIRGLEGVIFGLQLPEKIQNYEFIEQEKYELIKKNFDLKQAIDIREKAGLSKAALANLLSCDRLTLFRWEKGICPPHRRYVTWLVKNGYESEQKTIE